MIEATENFLFGAIASPWLFLIVGAICVISGTFLSPLFKGFYKQKDQFMTEQSGCGLVICGFIIMGIAAILWKLSNV